MKMKAKMKPAALAIYLLLVISGLVMAVIKWATYLNADIVVISPEIHSHISNLVISMELLLAVGAIWLMLGLKMKYITALGAVLIALNIICETAMGFMNTVDILDALYGVIGVLAAYAFLFYADKYGMVRDK